ncbi:RNA-directed RNA polymerase [Achlya hypogyna]|uniref:RNA-dependent RNA polymerase n=1 Tax=Achlya hypogyna TaxID=1202772 RepID=A0A1V9Z8D0_ACHHY|nr:RNA-directed RNA polymerase [Achlya hypogyna]
MGTNDDAVLAALVQSQTIAHEASLRKAERAEAFARREVRRHANVFAVTLGNVPLFASAADVADFCLDVGGVQGFLLVELPPPPRHGNSTRATLRVAAEEDVHRLLELDDYVWHGEPVTVSPAAVRGRVDVFAQQFRCTDFHVLSSAHSDCPSYSSATDIVFSCASETGAAFGISFGHGDDQYRVKFKVTSVVRCRVGTTSHNQCVATITLRSPPFCYVQDGPENGRIWPASEDSFEWLRSTDPTPNRVFGTHRNYQLTFAPRWSASQIAATLRLFGVWSVDEAVGTLPTLRPAPTPLPVPLADWTCGYDDLFCHLPFTLRYALHVLLTHDALVFAHRSDAEVVAALLPPTTPATHVLAFLQSPTRHATDSLSAFLDWLETPPVVDLLDEAFAPLEAYGPDAAPATILHVRRALVTPLRIVVEPPDVDVSNRVLRMYAAHVDRFLRVSFVDENFGPLYGAKAGPIVSRVEALLTDGIVIAGETYTFLGYSNSQLRSHSCWFYRNPAPHERNVPQAEEIHAALGDFDKIPSASKRGARLGQVFSATTSTVDVSHFRCAVRKDIVRNGYIFSDGVGAISEDLSVQIAAHLRLNYVPSAYQIRYGGWKGMVAVDRSLPTAVADMELRDSMRKFASAHDAIEVCCVPQALPVYLNRQLITLLTTRGVRDEAILSLADAMLEDLSAPLESHPAALRFLRTYAPKAVVRRLVEVGVGLRDLFVRQWLQTLVRQLVADVRNKARVLVPDGVCLAGVLDEAGCLPEGCIFFQTTRFGGYSITPPPVGTRVLVGRNPSLHPGDLRILRYVDAPALRHLHDVVVFSSEGSRPVTDMMSGGDLDGDLYFVVWDPRLVPSTDEPPMVPVVQGLSPPPLLPGTPPLGVQQHFVRFLELDNLGMLANLHLAVADRSSRKARDTGALELAQAAAIAVDFAKSGIAARSPEVYVSVFPDFMERAGPSYASRSVLGVLYRRVQDFAPPAVDMAHSANVDSEIAVAGSEAFLEDARCHFVQYARALFALGQRYDVSSEIELVSGYFGGDRSRRADLRDDAAERIRANVRHVQEHFTQVFWADLGTSDPTHPSVLAKAAAWYETAYTYEWTTSAPPCLSFAWLALEPMCVLFSQQQV